MYLSIQLRKKHYGTNLNLNNFRDIKNYILVFYFFTIFGSKFLGNQNTFSFLYSHLYTIVCIQL